MRLIARSFRLRSIKKDPEIYFARLHRELHSGLRKNGAVTLVLISRRAPRAPVRRKVYDRPPFGTDDQTAPFVCH